MAHVTTLASRRTAQEQNEELPSFIAPAYDDMEPRWKLCRDMMLGTEAIRKDLDTYFPKGPAETVDEREARAHRAELFPMFKETVKGLVGLALRKDPVLGDDVPASIKTLWENIDGAGTHGSVFVKRVAADAIAKGHSGILVDVPKVTSSRPLTIRQTKDMGLRPYWVHIKPENIINWRTQTINGNVVLTLLVLSEVVDEPFGKFGTISVTRYRVFAREETTGAIQYEVWTQQTNDKDPELDSAGTLEGANRIPFVVVYAGERVAPLQSIPPLIDLAHTNVAHVQVLSDRRTSLHYAGNPILVIKGRNTSPAVTPDPNAPGMTAENPAVPGQVPTGAPIVVSATSGIDVDKDGDVTYAEHAGNALASSRQEMVDIETRAAAQGLSMLQRDTRAAQTAEAERMQQGEKDASLSTFARNLKDGLETALAFTAIMTAEPTGGSIELDMSFEETIIDTARIAVLLQMLVANSITRRTFWGILIKGGVLPEDFDMDKEDTALDAATALTLTQPGPTGGGGATDPGGSNANTDTGSGPPGGGPPQ